MRINALLGVAGVNPTENRQARRIGRAFEYLVLIALFVVFAQLLMLYSHQLDDANWLTNLVWLVFFLELVVNLYFVNNRVLYLKENWLNIAIVVAAFPWWEWGSDWATIIRSLRLVLFIRFFTGFFSDLVQIMGRNRFGQILVVFAFIIIAAGGLFAFLEDRTFHEGIWYALVTITTVGYGDVVPVSDEGRIFGMVLILFGVVFFSLVTANISAFLIGSEQRQLERDILNYMKQTDQRLAAQQERNQKHVEHIVKHMSDEISELKKEIKALKNDLNR
ncbi:potassium channel family protein [Thiomicrorhabdus sediminis]|nr:potassium channel family protein [Thiomicrorhabdus sediminis]